MLQTKTSSSQIINKSSQGFISTTLRQGFQNLLGQVTHWLADIPKTIFAKTPFELNYTDKHFWAAHFAGEIESLKAELIEGLTLKKLQNRLVELQGIIGKYTLSPVVYRQSLFELQIFSAANKDLTDHADAVANVLQDFKAALQEQTAFVRECFAGDSQLWLQQLGQPSRKVYADIIHLLTAYQIFTVPGVYLSLLLQLRQQAIVVSPQTALIRHLTVMIFALERQGICPIEKDEEKRDVKDEENDESLKVNKEASAIAEKKDFLRGVFDVAKGWGEYVLSHPAQAVTLGLAAQAAAAAALESSLTIKKTSQDRTFMQDIQQAAQQAPFDKLGQALAAGLASTAQATSDSSIRLPVAQVNTQLRSMQGIRTDNKGGNGVTPAVAGLNQGDFVIIGQCNATSGILYKNAHDNIFGWQYNNTGYLLDEFQVNNFTVYTQAAPVVAGLNGGGFAVTWQSFNQTNDSGCTSKCWDIYARTYNSLATSFQANEFLVNTDYTHGDQSQPAIASLNNGGFVVSWQSSMGTTGYDVYAQQYNSDAVPVGNNFLVNSYTNNNQIRPALTGLNDGGFVITWESFGQVLSGYSSIYVRQFNLSGSPLGNETWVDFDNSYIYQGTNPAIASLQDGGFIITWQSTENGGIYGRQYNASSSPQGGQFQVNINNNTNGVQSDPSVAGLNKGGFVVVWNNNQTGSGVLNIYAREYDVSDNPIAGECPIKNEDTPGNQFYPVVASLNDGNFVIVWQDQSYYGEGSKILQPGFSINNCTGGISSTSTTAVPSTTVTTSIGTTTPLALTTTALANAGATTSMPSSMVTATPTSGASSTVTATMSLSATTGTTSTATIISSIAATTASTDMLSTLTTNGLSSTATASTSIISTAAAIGSHIGFPSESSSTSSQTNSSSIASNTSNQNTIIAATVAVTGSVAIVAAAVGIWKCRKNIKVQFGQGRGVELGRSSSTTDDQNPYRNTIGI